MKRVLIVDDSADALILLRAILEEAGYEVLEAQNGEMALELYKTNSVDLVITDIMMPIKDGLVLIIELKDINPDIKIIAISADSDLNKSTALDSAELLGANFVIKKPVNKNVLIEKIETLHYQ